jgi:hypothetical protein
MRGGRLVAALLVTAVLMGIVLALVMKEQKKAWRAKHPSKIQPLR